MTQADLEALETFAVNIAEARHQKRAEQVRSAIAELRAARTELETLRERVRVLGEECRASRALFKLYDDDCFPQIGWKHDEPDSWKARDQRLIAARRATDEKGAIK